jgi:hypothetical protein
VTRASVVRAFLILLPLTTCAARLHMSAAAPDAVARELTRSLNVVAQIAAARRSARLDLVRPRTLEFVERPRATRAAHAPVSS